ncbi:MAG: lamin tail domain-containing protein [Sandaracinaceae bacterium]
MCAGLITALAACDSDPPEPDGGIMADGGGGTDGGVTRPPAFSGYLDEHLGGRFHDLPIPGDFTVESVFAALGDDIPEDFDEIRPEELALDARNVRGPFEYVTMHQTVNDVAIHGTFVNSMFDMSRDQPHLVASGYRVYEGVQIDTTETVMRAQAETAALEVLREVGGDVDSAELVVWDLSGTLQLVWNVTVEGRFERALVYANGPRAGEVTVIDDRHFGDGQIDGHIVRGGAPGGRGVSDTVALPNLFLRDGEGSVIATTDELGRYSVPDGTALSVGLDGAAATIFDVDGQDVIASGGDSGTLTLGTIAEEAAEAQVTTYFFVDQMRSFLLANGVDGAAIGDPLTTFVNIDDACNAFYSPAERSINFYRARDECQNTSEPTIIAHEYGHFVDDVFGGITDFGLSEGWGDLLSCLLFETPVVGPDLFGEEPLRTCDNDYQFPPSARDEVHDLGQAWAGFGWHLRENLIASEGEEQGAALAVELLLPSLVSNAATTPQAIREVLVRDDDDGDLTNGTPHYDAILEAATRHDLTFALELDVTPPSPVRDLTVDARALSATFTWVAPGDDGETGQAAYYDVRGAYEPVTESNFATLRQFAVPDPAAAGTQQQFTQPLNSSTTYYVGVRAVDQHGNRSELLSFEFATIDARILHDYAFEGDANGWESDGLWHVSDVDVPTGEGAFRFADPATGTYETADQSAVAGVLRSPIIDLGDATGVTLFWTERLHLGDSQAEYDIANVVIRSVEARCENTCADAGNGMCDEGEGGTCEAGTDCGDCGEQNVVVNELVIPKELRAIGTDALPYNISLPEFEGQQIQIEFQFDSVDGLANGTSGWFIDDVIIAADAIETGPAPAEGELLINEVLAAPPTGYDANGDGVVSSTQDEFVELVNVGDAALDLSGATLEDAIRTRFTFDEGVVLQPNEALVVFGGGFPTGVPALAFSSGGLGLNNTGDTVRVRRRDGELLAEVSYGRLSGQSWVRREDGVSATDFVPHVSVSSFVASPGLRSDGTAFGDPFVMPPPSEDLLVLTEVLADPPVGLDTNNDGEASTTDDEFVESYNAGSTDVDMSGYTLSDSVGERFVFPAGTTLSAGQVLVVFGGGVPSVPYPAFAANRLALNNTGDAVWLADTEGAVVDVLAYGSEGGRDASLHRTDETDPLSLWVPHGELAATPASPGTRPDGSPF